MEQNKNNQKAYELIARIYAGDVQEEDDPVMRATCRNLFIDSLHGKNILEIGCGPGIDAFFFHKLGYNITATDFCKEFLTIVKERFPGMTCLEMDMTRPNLELSTFDGIYSFASFIHIPRHQAVEVLRGIFNLLKGHGVLFLSVIESKKYPEYIIDNWGGVENNPVLFTCYTPEELTQLLKLVGFKRVEIHRIDSELYKNLPRLVERGVNHYQVLANRE
jgi:2-polyprenyl-3-methyl-5-hydroxy-6-metoxy-1,4-benzoquinol methylase